MKILFTFTTAVLLAVVVPMVRATPLTYGVFAVPGATVTSAAGVNDSGEIAGTYYIGNNLRNGFIRSSYGSTYTTVAVPGATGTALNGINNDGDVVGVFYNTSGAPNPFMLLANGAYGFFQSLGPFSDIDGINDSDQVVGSANAGVHSQQRILYVF